MLPENKAALQKLAKEYQFSASQISQSFLYVELIERCNQHTNLVSRQDVGRIVSRHFHESLWFCLPQVINDALNVLDLGSGAGFPGVPMKIYEPGLLLTLLDARKKKAHFLNEVVHQLEWSDVSVLDVRAEDLPSRQPGMVYDLVVCRAVAKMVELWNWAKPLLVQGGALAVLKGGNLEKEMDLLMKKYPAISWKMIDLPELPADPSAGRKIILVRKR